MSEAIDDIEKDLEGWDRYGSGCGDPLRKALDSAADAAKDIGESVDGLASVITDLVDHVRSLEARIEQLESAKATGAQP